MVLLFLCHLPVLIPWYVLDIEQATPESLVVLEPGLEEVDEVLFCLLVASLEHHEGSRKVTVLLVRHRHHGGVSNAIIISIDHVIVNVALQKSSQKHIFCNVSGAGGLHVTLCFRKAPVF